MYNPLSKRLSCVYDAEHVLRNPETDMAIAMRYNKSTWQEAKAVNKSRLLATVGLPLPATVNGNRVPLFGVVTRLVHQKGLQVNDNNNATIFFFF